MIPQNYKLTAVPNFGAAVNIVVRGRPHKIAGDSGVLQYGTSVELINSSNNNDNPVSSASQDNTVNAWYDWQGVIEVQTAGGAITGECALYLVNEETGLESDAERSRLLTTVEITSSSAAERQDWFTDR